jgi:hypothetical protein
VKAAHGNKAGFTSRRFSLYSVYLFDLKIPLDSSSCILTNINEMHFTAAMTFIWTAVKRRNTELLFL